MMQGFADRVRAAVEPTCSRCYRPATVRVVGKWGNGRDAVDLRCTADAPDPTLIGTWAWMGTSDREFRIDKLESVA